MDVTRIADLIILALVQLIGVVVYIVITRERLNFVFKRLEQYELHHTKHFEHAQQDAVKFGEINTQLAVLLQGQKHIESDIGLIRQSFHEVRNAMSIVIGKAALMGMTTTKPDSKDL